MNENRCAFYVRTGAAGMGKFDNVQHLMAANLTWLVPLDYPLIAR